MLLYEHTRWPVPFLSDPECNNHTNVWVIRKKNVPLYASTFEVMDEDCQKPRRCVLLFMYKNAALLHKYRLEEEDRRIQKVRTKNENRNQSLTERFPASRTSFHPRRVDKGNVLDEGKEGRVGRKKQEEYAVEQVRRNSFVIQCITNALCVVFRAHSDASHEDVFVPAIMQQCDVVNASLEDAFYLAPFRSSPSPSPFSTILLSNFATLSPCTTFRMQI